jgi:hypothetical protein
MITKAMAAVATVAVSVELVLVPGPAYAESYCGDRYSWIADLSLRDRSGQDDPYILSVFRREDGKRMGIETSGEHTAFRMYEKAIRHGTKLTSGAGIGSSGCHTFTVKRGWKLRLYASAAKHKGDPPVAHRKVIVKIK